jgi:hypothetical protein
MDAELAEEEDEEEDKEEDADEERDRGPWSWLGARPRLGPGMGWPSG